MTGKISFWGGGPKYSLYSAAYCIFIISVSRYVDPFFEITLIPYTLSAITGIFLIMLGVPFYVISLVTIKRAYSAERLVTEGTFSMCRHPVYSAWIVFFVPGIMLLINTWLGLSAPIVMYVLVHLFTKKEELFLEKTFGSEYLEYKKRVPMVLPIGWLMS